MKSQILQSAHTAYSKKTESHWALSLHYGLHEIMMDSINNMFCLLLDYFQLSL